MSTTVSAQVTLPAPLQHIFEAQQAAWNSGDGTAWAEGFSEDAGFVNIRGDALQGRAAIAQQHSRIFAGPYVGSRTSVHVESLTELAPGIVRVATIHEVTGFKALPPGITLSEPGPLRTRMNYIAVAHGEKWQIVFAQNTVILPAPAEAGRII